MAEHQVVALGVVGSNPISHPKPNPRAVTSHPSMDTNVMVVLSVYTSGVNAREYLTTSEFAQLNGVSRATVARLVDRGRIPGRRVGTHRRIFKSDLEAAGFMSPTILAAPPTRAGIARLARRIKVVAARHGARNVRLFGSVARETADEASDVDLVVDLDPDRSLIDLAALEIDLERILGRRVDLATAGSLPARAKEAVLRDSVAL